MECREIQKRLSAYIEKAVSSQKKALIDEHLKGCKRCRQALADLKKTIKYVQKLEEVEPPAWLVQKVMARVRAEAEAEEKPGILKKLFYPIHIKLPLEAIAVIFIAVGTLYIFKTMQPQMQLAKIPTETKEMAPAPAPKKEKPPVLEKQKPAPAPAADRYMYEKRLETREQGSVGMAKAPAETAPADIRRQEEAAPAVPAAGTTYRDEVNRRGLLAPKAVSPKTAAPGKAKEVRFFITVKDLEIASKDIEETLQLLGGKAIKTEPLGNKAVIAAEIDANKVQELFDKLNLIGEVQEKGMAAEAGEGAVGIRIDILKTPTSN